MCLSEGSVCDGQDFPWPQTGVKPVMANSLKVGVRDWRGKLARVCRHAAT